jgi:hypothetical protein
VLSRDGPLREEIQSLAAPRVKKHMSFPGKAVSEKFGSLLAERLSGCGARVSRLRQEVNCFNKNGLQIDFIQGQFAQAGM